MSLNDNMAPMRFSRPNADVFVPSGETVQSALARSSLLGVGAHQDDLECMAFYPILAGCEIPGEAFCGVILSDGAASAGGPGQTGAADLPRLRREEQRKAARLGRYAALIQMDHSSSAVKDPAAMAVVDDLEALFRTVQPREVYTHNPADKHDTHVAVCLKVLAALRRLPMQLRPKRLVGCEVWRDLDWLGDTDKVRMDVGGREALAASLLQVFESQNRDGKRFDLASLGRRRAHATFFQSHAGTASDGLIFGMDLTPLLLDDGLSPRDLCLRHLEAFKADVLERLNRLGRA
jgi:LmbE family N-acetylglucosaminyl deacetylase